MSSNGPIRKPPPTRTIRSIWSMGAMPLAEHPQRLEREGPREPVGDEADRVGRADRLAAHRPRDLGGRLQRLRGGVVAGDDLDQAHQRRRVEEVHAAHPLRPLDAGGDRGHRQGGGVRGEDRLRPAELGQFGEQAALQLEVLRRRLDHELAFAELLDALHEVQPFLRRLSLGFAPHPANGALREAVGHPGLTCGKRLARRVVEPGLEPAQAGELGDPRAHGPGADDSNPLDSQASAP